jgi:hypothetical protein
MGPEGLRSSGAVVGMGMDFDLILAVAKPHAAGRRIGLARARRILEYNAGAANEPLVPMHRRIPEPDRP